MSDEKRSSGRPNLYESGKMVMRSFRFPAELIEAAHAKAEKEGTKISELLRNFLEDYVKGTKTP